MGKLFEYREQIEKHIATNNLDVFKTRGKLAMKCGFIVTLIRPDEPDDPEKMKLLQEAADEVLGLKLY